MMALAIDNIKGLNLFDVFQSVLGFIAHLWLSSFC
jgi:SSS family solute:Na+ symporter